MCIMQPAICDTVHDINRRNETCMEPSLHPGHSGRFDEILILFEIRIQLHK